MGIKKGHKVLIDHNGESIVGEIKSSQGESNFVIKTSDKEDMLVNSSNILKKIKKRKWFKFEEVKPPKDMMVLLERADYEDLIYVGKFMDSKDKHKWGCKADEDWFLSEFWPAPIRMEEFKKWQIIP